MNAGILLVAALHLLSAQSDSLRVTFLGTGGGPMSRPELAGPATLIEYNREVILIDAGRGAVQRMQQLNRRIPQIKSIFLTHLHSDHTTDIPDVWLRSWWGEGRRKPLEVRGPKGTRAMAEHIAQAWSYDVDIRSHEPENINPAMAKLIGIDVDTGVVYEENGLRVTAIRADHGPVLSLAYRIDAGGHSVVLAGDDRQSPQVIAHAQNVDVLAHSAAIFAPPVSPDTGIAAKKRKGAVALLPSAEMAAAVFSQSRPRLAVVYHWFHNERVLDAIRTAGYTGPLQGADDLMEIIISDSVRVTHAHTIVAVFAHPDDERAVGPILARYAREGANVYLVIATDGRKGAAAHAHIPLGDSLAHVRVGEANCATRALGVNAPIMLGHADGGLAGFAALDSVRRDLRKTFAELKPDAILTFGPEGGTGHPDHRLIGVAVTDVVQGGDFTDALYYPALPAERMSDAPPARPTMNAVKAKYLPVHIAFTEADFEATRRAYACHESQYTLEQVNANMAYMKHGWNGQVWLRRWNDDKARSAL